MTAVETLRRAAREMREKAEAANTDEWGALVDNYLGGDLGTHFAAWSPTVALAVADWLDDSANAAESLSRLVRCPVETVLNKRALATARAFLREVTP